MTERSVAHATFVIDVTDTFEQKLAAIGCYRSQFDENRFDRIKHTITAHNATQGSRCGFTYGELFALPHPVGTGDLYGLVMGGKGSPAPSAARWPTSSRNWRGARACLTKSFPLSSESNPFPER